MTTVQQLYEAMQALAPLELAESWDNPGLLVDCAGEVTRVLVTLDITPEVVTEAAAKHCEAIVAHHPVTRNASLPIMVLNSSWFTKK